MVELVGDTCKPSSLVIPAHTTTVLDTISGNLVTDHLESGLIVFNSTTQKLEYWDGTIFQVITSTDAR